MNLFAIINRAKSLGTYATANLAFACLLDKAIDSEGYKFYWEGENGFRCYAHPNCLEDSYYDLAVISDGLREACIPVPLLKEGVAKAFLQLVGKEGFIWRREHNRQRVRLVSIKLLQSEIDELNQKILGAFPNAHNLERKYLVLKCQNCPYFDESHSIHCSVFPLGVPEEFKKFKEKIRMVSITTDSTYFKYESYMQEFVHCPEHPGQIDIARRIMHSSTLVYYESI